MSSSDDSQDDVGPGVGRRTSEFPRPGVKPKTIISTMRTLSLSLIDVAVIGGGGETSADLGLFGKKKPKPHPDADPDYPENGDPPGGEEDTDGDVGFDWPYSSAGGAFAIKTITGM